jgi:hypothetical protein
MKQFSGELDKTIDIQYIDLAQENYPTIGPNVI